MPRSDQGFPAALFILGLVGLLYAFGQAAGWLPELSGVPLAVLGFFGIVGMVIGGYYLSD
jgi:hypothetical protein